VERGTLAIVTKRGRKQGYSLGNGNKAAITVTRFWFRTYWRGVKGKWVRKNRQERKKVVCWRWPARLVPNYFYE